MRFTSLGDGHHFVGEARRQPAARPSLMSRIVREYESLATALPDEPSASIYVRVDARRMSLSSAIIVGPAGTPYAGGLFEFHVLLPAEYPDVPPLVHIATTGNGAVRFNPNLYASGKVCLSLLGTWHASGDETSRWNAASSTLLQVLVSITGLIMIDEP